MILIGSRALSIRNQRLLNRSPSDFDFICSEQEAKDFLEQNKDSIGSKKIYDQSEKIISEGDVNIEFEITSRRNSSLLFKEFVEVDSETIKTSMGLVPSLDLLFLLKTSHRYLKNSPHFFKTLCDWHAMQSAGAKITQQHQLLLDEREKETYANQKHPKLDMSKNEFFAVEDNYMIFDHDSIHESVAEGSYPAYLQYLKNDSEVKSDKKKFFACSESIRDAGVREETSVLAIERSLIPFPSKLTPRQAWLFAFSKVCSSITSGFFRQYAFENAPRIISKYNDNYWNKFQQDLNDGKIKSFP